mmetsp:Transcript_51051/g.134500  ORF Transcript_51051/g.134500 Transcript_51051/m.134500 type:complete len:159 (-) Transcript_51051:84-560(-)
MLDKEDVKTVCPMLLLTCFSISMFVCLARPDFNLIAYLMGYYIWVKDDEVSMKQRQAIHTFNCSLAVISCLDLSWLLWAHSSWTCPYSEEVRGACGEEANDYLRAVSGVHWWCMGGSWVAFILKIIVICVQSLWLMAETSEDETAQHAVRGEELHLAK